MVNQSRGLFNVKAILVEKQQEWYLTHSVEGKEINIFFQKYVYKSQRNSMTGIWTRLQQYCSPAR